MCSEYAAHLGAHLADTLTPGLHRVLFGPLLKLKPSSLGWVVQRAGSGRGVVTLLQLFDSLT